MSEEEIYHTVLHQWLTEDLKLVFLFSQLGEIAFIKIDLAYLRYELHHGVSYFFVIPKFHFKIILIWC